MKKSLILSLVACSLIATTASAQKEKKPSILTESTSIVKFTPTKIFRGIVLFGYEHAVGDRTSIEVSAGPTISNVSPFGVNGHGIWDIQGGLGNSTGSSLGFHVAAAIKYYPMEEKWVNNGFYVSPEVGFTRYNYLFQNDFAPDVDETGYKQETAFGFIFGSQNWLSKSFGLDMYMGAGLKSINYVSYFSNYDYMTGQPTWIKQSENRASWYLTAGVKVGIGLKTKK